MNIVVDKCRLGETVNYCKRDMEEKPKPLLEKIVWGIFGTFFLGLVVWGYIWLVKTEIEAGTTRNLALLPITLIITVWPIALGWACWALAIKGKESDRLF